MKFCASLVRLEWWFECLGILKATGMLDLLVLIFSLKSTAVQKWLSFVSFVKMTTKFNKCMVHVAASNACPVPVPKRLSFVPKSVLDILYAITGSSEFMKL